MQGYKIKNTLLYNSNSCKSEKKTLRDLQNLAAATYWVKAATILIISVAQVCLTDGMC